MSISTDPSKPNPDLAIHKQELHGRLGSLVNNLVGKIQGKHESLIEKQSELARCQIALKDKYLPIFDQLQFILNERKMDYMDRMI
jgi:hypothetical protein